MSKTKAQPHVVLPGEEVDDDPTGAKKVERIYLNRIAAQIVQNSKDLIQPQRFRLPSDSQAYRLAIEYVSKYMFENHLELSLEVADHETNHKIRPEKHHPDHIARCLHLNKNKPVLAQLIGSRLGPIPAEVIESIAVPEGGKLIESDDESQMTAIMATQASDVPSLTPERKSHNRHSSSHRHHHHRSHHHRSSKHNDEPETFTGLGEEKSENPNIWESSYALSEEKRNKLSRKSPHRHHRRHHKPEPEPVSEPQYSTLGYSYKTVTENAPSNAPTYSYQSVQQSNYSVQTESVSHYKAPKEQRTWAELEKSSVSHVEPTKSRFHDLFSKLIQQPILVSDPKPVIRPVEVVKEPESSRKDVSASVSSVKDHEDKADPQPSSITEVSDSKQNNLKKEDQTSSKKKVVAKPESRDEEADEFPVPEEEDVVDSPEEDNPDNEEEDKLNEEEDKAEEEDVDEEEAALE